MFRQRKWLILLVASLMLTPTSQAYLSVNSIQEASVFTLLQKWYIKISFRRYAKMHHLITFDIFTLQCSLIHRVTVGWVCVGIALRTMFDINNSMNTSCRCVQNCLFPTFPRLYHNQISIAENTIF